MSKSIYINSLVIYLRGLAPIEFAPSGVAIGASAVFSDGCEPLGIVVRRTALSDRRVDEDSSNLAEKELVLPATFRAKRCPRLVVDGSTE